MTQKKLLTAHGRKLLKASVLPLVTGVSIIIAVIALAGCQTAGQAMCRWLPDGSYTCSGEVNGL